MNSNLNKLKTALQSADEETRHAAIVGLMGIAVQETCTLLFTAMGDQSWRVRKEAVDVFVSSHPEDVMVVELLELLRSPDNAGLRNSAVEALVKLGRRSMALLAGLAHDSDADVRKFVIDAMGAMGSPFFYDYLLTALDDQDVNVAAAAAEHLGDLDDPRAVPCLIRTIVGNTSNFYRFSALIAIAKLETPAEIPPEILQLADDDILQKAVYACLGSSADESAVSTLVDGLASRQVSSRKAAVIALHKIYLRSEAESRRSIEKTVQLLRGEETVPLLIDLFDRADPELCEALIVTLDNIQDVRCIDVFVKAMSIERLTDFAINALERAQQLQQSKDFA